MEDKMFMLNKNVGMRVLDYANAKVRIVDFELGAYSDLAFPSVEMLHKVMTDEATATSIIDMVLHQMEVLKPINHKR